MVELQDIPNSSTIDATGYDIGSQTLAIRFKSGVAIYHYKGVPADVAQGLSEADSIGKFFHANVKGVFEVEKINPDDADQDA